MSMIGKVVLSGAQRELLTAMAGAGHDVVLPIGREAYGDSAYRFPGGLVACRANTARALVDRGLICPIGGTIGRLTHLHRITEAGRAAIAEPDQGDITP